MACPELQWNHVQAWENLGKYGKASNMLILEAGNIVIQALRVRGRSIMNREMLIGSENTPSSMLCLSLLLLFEEEVS
jgi:hypothetical protein